MDELQELSGRDLAIMTERNRAALYDLEIGYYNDNYFFSNAYYAIRLTKNNLISVIEFLDQETEIQKVVKSYFVENLNEFKGDEVSLWSIFEKCVDNDKNKSIVISPGGSYNKYDKLEIKDLDNCNCENYDFIMKDTTEDDGDKAIKSDVVIGKNRLFYNQNEKALVEFGFDYVFNSVVGPYYFKHIDEYVNKQPFIYDKNKQIIVMPKMSALAGYQYKRIKIKDNGNILIKNDK